MHPQSPAFPWVNGGENAECVSDEVLFSPLPLLWGGVLVDVCCCCCCVQCFFFFFFALAFSFFRLTHLSGKQNRLPPVGGRNSHLEIKKKKGKKKSPPTSHAQLPSSIFLFVCFLAVKWGEKKGKMKWTWNCSLSFTHQQASISTQVQKKVTSPTRRLMCSLHFPARPAHLAP